LVTIGILFALKGGSFRAFYRWLKRDYSGSSKPIKTGVNGCWLSLPYFTIIDSYPIELIFPIRQGRSPLQVGKKGQDKGRWSVGIKLCWLMNAFGRVAPPPFTGGHGASHGQA